MQGKPHSFSTGWCVVFELRAAPCGKTYLLGLMWYQASAACGSPGEGLIPIQYYVYGLSLMERLIADGLICLSR